jgi:hypothetical protein
MPGPSLVIIVEGDGEVEAFPILLRRLLGKRGCWDIIISNPPINTHGIGNITKDNGLESFLELALRRPSCDAILILVDADSSCSKDFAIDLARRAFAYSCHIPTAVVATKYRYENWFLASLETLMGNIGLMDNLEIINCPEGISDPKRFLTEKMIQGRAYRETMDMAPMTNLLDINLVHQRSRSFRRLNHALDELIESILSGIPKVTPI